MPIYSFIGWMVGLVGGFLGAYIINRFVSTNSWVPPLIIIASVVFGAVIGALVYEIRRYRKILKFRDEFLWEVQELVNTRLSGLAEACDVHSNAISSLKSKGVDIVAPGSHFDSLYSRMLADFQSSQTNFYRAYDAVAGVLEVDTGWKNSLVLKGRSYKLYLFPVDEKSPSVKAKK